MDKNTSIEVTEQMVSAATNVLWESGALKFIADGPDQLLVKEMLVEAIKVSVTQNM